MESFGKSSLQPGKNNRDAATFSEDCLFLNIWTPAKKTDEKLPVMFWIHGGGFTDGSGNLSVGSALAERGIVLVSINYRLGPMGFFAHPLLSEESDLTNNLFHKAIAESPWINDAAISPLKNPAFSRESVESTGI
jgi:para-nitrobenzyl esterase